jgi:hypothetical protein
MNLQAAKSEIRNPPGTRWIDVVLEAAVLVGTILLAVILFG